MKNLIKKLLPLTFLSWYHFLLAFFGALIYRFPSRELKVIGVTGTGGKSTVVEFCQQVLKEAGYKTASISSISFRIRDKERPNTLKMTMPGRLKLQRFLRQAVKAGCQYAVLEVTSEGILQHRQKFINFEAAIFTNLSPEHIERHGSFEKYREAKGKLFKQTKKIHITNGEDENAEYFLKFLAKKKIGFPKAKNIQESPTGVSFEVQNTKFNLNLLGKFNVSNALAAISLGLSQGIDLSICQRALEKIKGMPGRMELVIKEPFRVIVDYAHTPDSLEKVYNTLKTTHYPLLTTHLICVLGSCGGGRDKWKRPKLGEIASEYCHNIIITNEDPYDEPPQKIMDQIEEGISINQLNQHKSAVYKILDRREAISEALKSARAGNTVIITGKGCESWMCVAGGKKIPWDDREIVKQEFKKLNL